MALLGYGENGEKIREDEISMKQKANYEGSQWQAHAQQPTSEIGIWGHCSWYRKF